MGKMKLAIMMCLITEISLYLFVSSENKITSLLGFFLNIETWTTSSFFAWFIPSVALIGAGAIIIGTFVNKVDWIWRAGVATVFMTFASSLIFLGRFIYSQDILSPANAILTTMMIAPLFLFYLFAIIDFISAKD